MRIIGYKLNQSLIKITENGFNRVKINLDGQNLRLFLHESVLQAKPLFLIPVFFCKEVV